MTLEWALPQALPLLLVVPLYLLVARSRRVSMPLPRVTNIREAGHATKFIGHFPAAARAAALIALVLAIAGPSSAGAVIEERREGIPIVLAIDISSSMLAQDFLPRDRLEVAKATIARFVESRAADPIGVVAFAGEALTLVPTTMHRPVLLSALESLRVGLLEDGTAIGDGLAIGVNRLRRDEVGSSVIVLLSDGENNRGAIDPLAAADAAAALGVQVFTVGVGSEGVARVPIGSAPAGFRYAELPVGLDEDLLREIATRTGGAYFRATDPAALDRIYGEIDRLVPSVVETTRHVERTEWAAFLLILAGVLVAGEWAVRGSRWGAIP
ncbi:MAG TPA: VWA domain-containing protein [Longimicrobiaceae bacterium]|nr:VWA domain-containing protein [Longimicrobiaceae bacterium]